MVKLLKTHNGIFLSVKNPIIQPIEVYDHRKAYEKEVIEALNVSGDFIKKFYSKFGLQERPKNPLIVFNINYYANPLHWLLTIPGPHRPTNEPVSSVAHEVAHCLHFKANPLAWEQKISGNKKAHDLIELVAELSSHMYLESIGKLQFAIDNFPHDFDSEFDKSIIQNYETLKAGFEKLIYGTIDDGVSGELDKIVFPS